MKNDYNDLNSQLQLQKNEVATLQHYGNNADDTIRQLREEINLLKSQSKGYKTRYEKKSAKDKKRESEDNEEKNTRSKL